MYIFKENTEEQEGNSPAWINYIPRRADRPGFWNASFYENDEGHQGTWVVKPLYWFL